MISFLFSPTGPGRHHRPSTPAGYPGQVGSSGRGLRGHDNFATAPDISAATYYIDSTSVDDPTLNVYKIPCGILPGGTRLEPFVQASFGYLDYEATFNHPAPGIDQEADWKSYGGLLGWGST